MGPTSSLCSLGFLCSQSLKVYVMFHSLFLRVVLWNLLDLCRCLIIVKCSVKASICCKEPNMRSGYSYTRNNLYWKLFRQSKILS
jgi:hypothetical protein